jgi:hypothetical protein
MFGPQSNSTNEQLFSNLRHFAAKASTKLMDNIQAELWRRNVTQQDYLDWLKTKKDQESDEGKRLT